MFDSYVTPVNDLIEHDETSEDCVCGPETLPMECEDGSINWVLAHHSLDGRELKEEA
ncbi:hypothetical protein [Gulosibacter sediminis]|uniref:hypothetical protein n=1 Tax=Gulosibacter sediminis TaxID=1729695 RepID=UPI0024A91560|nr:hypothetical protein [Gulosibacter sediminis]